MHPMYNYSDCFASLASVNKHFNNNMIINLQIKRLLKQKKNTNKCNAKIIEALIILNMYSLVLQPGNPETDSIYYTASVKRIRKTKIDG